MMALSKDSIRLDYYATDWKDAVAEAGRLLVNAGLTTGQYIDGMIELVETHGAYMLVAPGVAMPHAQPAQGVMKTGISFLTLREPVEFPAKKENPITLLIGVAAENPDTHLDVIGNVAELIFEDASRLRLMQCKDPDEICRLVND